MKIAKCLKCHGRWEIDENTIKIERCKFCKENMFLQIYSSSNVKGGVTEMVKQKDESTTPQKEKPLPAGKIRDDLGDKIVDLLKASGVDKKHWTAGIGRAYRKIKEKK